MSSFSFRQVMATCFDDRQIDILQNACIGIAGCGGLGSNCAQELVRCGIGKLVIADFDVVEIGNLNRQTYLPIHLGRPKAECLAEVLTAINPDLQVTICAEKLHAESARKLFQGCKAVVEAFDSPEAKAMLASVFLKAECGYVTASGLAGYGNSDRIQVRQLNANSWMVGDTKTGVEHGHKPYAPGVQIAAAKEADIILYYLLNQSM